MQGIPATGHDDDGDADDGDDAAFVVLVRDENVRDDDDGYMLHAKDGGRGGFSPGASFRPEETSRTKEGALTLRRAMRRSRRVACLCVRR